jgi:hypothetical protein
MVFPRLLLVGFPSLTSRARVLAADAGLHEHREYGGLLGGILRQEREHPLSISWLCALVMRVRPASVLALLSRRRPREEFVDLSASRACSSRRNSSTTGRSSSSRRSMSRLTSVRRSATALPPERETKRYPERHRAEP